MNPWAQVSITVGSTALLNLILAVFLYGQLTQKVKDLTSWSKEHNEQLHAHGDQLTDHERRISHIEGRKGIPLRTD